MASSVPFPGLFRADGAGADGERAAEAASASVRALFVAQGQPRDRAPLADFEAAFVRAAAAVFAPAARFVELGSALGALPLTLAAAGYEAAGFEGDLPRHFLALDMLDFARTRNFSGADKVDLYYRHLPDDAAPALPDRIPIVSNVVLAPKYVSYDPWLDVLAAYPMAIVNLGRFIERRTAPEQQDALREKFAAVGFTAIRTIHRDAKGGTNYVLFANQRRAWTPPSVRPPAPGMEAMAAALGARLKRRAVVVSPGQRNLSGADLVFFTRPDDLVGETYGGNAGAVLIGWLDGEIAAWIAAGNLERFALLFCPSRDAADAVRAATGREARVLPAGADAAALAAAVVAEFLAGGLRFGIKIGVTRRAAREIWGDYHYGLALKRALERLGCAARVDIVAEWHDGAGVGDDIALVVRGPVAYRVPPGRRAMLWLISHAAETGLDELRRYDHVFVASNLYAAKLAAALGDRVSPLIHCSDPEVFRPGMPSPLCNCVIFVGSTRGARRPIVEWAIAAGIEFTVFGSGWEGKLPAGVLAGSYVPNRELGGYYGNGNIVLNDHWPDLAAEGFPVNRLFDAGAVGATILSDEVAGLHDIFGDLIETCGSPEELRAAVERLRSDPRRAERGERLRQLILAKHTFDHRAREIVARARKVMG